MDFDENSAFVLEFLIAIGILLKISAALFLKVLESVEVAISGAELDRRCLLFSFSDMSMYSGLFRSDVYLKANWGERFGLVNGRCSSGKWLPRGCSVEVNNVSIVLGKQWRGSLLHKNTALELFSDLFKQLSMLHEDLCVS